MVLSSYVCSEVFFFRQKTAYEMRISDWSSDVCSSDLINSATKGFVNCGTTPKGSSVASNAAPKSNTAPISSPGYNQGVAYAAAPAAPRPTPVRASAAPTHGSMPIGSPLDSSPDFQGGPALPIAAAPTSPPYDVPQPRQRVRGTIEQIGRAHV